MLHVPIIILSSLIILVIYLIFSTKEQFLAKFVNGVCEVDNTYNEYESIPKCENRYVCDSKFGRCKKQAAPKLIKDSMENIIDVSYPNYPKCKEKCKFIPRQGVTNPRRCDVVPHAEIQPTDSAFVEEGTKGISREYGELKKLTKPTDMVFSDTGLESIKVDTYTRKDDCENRYRCNEFLGICEKTAGGEYILERNCEKNCRIKSREKQDNKLLIHFSVFNDTDAGKHVVAAAVDPEPDIGLIKTSLKDKIRTRIPNFDDLIDTNDSGPNSLYLFDSKCELDGVKSPLFPKKNSFEFIFKPEVIYDIIYENFITLVNGPLQFTVKNGEKNVLYEADYMYIEYDGKSPLCKKVSMTKFEDFKNYTLLEILDANDDYELKKLSWNEVDQTDISNYNVNSFNFRYNKSAIELPKLVHMSAVKIEVDNLDEHYKNNVASISGFKFEIYNLDEYLLDNFKHKIYLDTDVINYAKKNYTDLKLLKIGLDDPNKVFDKLHEVLFLLYRNPNYEYYYKQLEVELDKYTKLKYGLKRIHPSSPTESEIKNYEDKSILNRVIAGMGNPTPDANNREKLLINLYSNKLEFKLKLNIFKDEILTDIITYKEEPLIKSG